MGQNTSFLCKKRPKKFGVKLQNHNKPKKGVFQGKFQCQPLFFDKIRYIHEKKTLFYNKNCEKIQVSNYKIVKNGKICISLAQMRWLLPILIKNTWFRNKECGKNSGVKLQNCWNWMKMHFSAFFKMSISNFFHILCSEITYFLSI